MEHKNFKLDSWHGFLARMGDRNYVIMSGSVVGFCEYVRLMVIGAFMVSLATISVLAVTTFFGIGVYDIINYALMGKEMGQAGLWILSIIVILLPLIGFLYILNWYMEKKKAKNVKQRKNSLMYDSFLTTYISKVRSKLCVLIKLN